MSGSYSLFQDDRQQSQYFVVSSVVGSGLGPGWFCMQVFGQEYMWGLL